MSTRSLTALFGGSTAASGPPRRRIVLLGCLAWSAFARATTAQEVAPLRGRPGGATTPIMVLPDGRRVAPPQQPAGGAIVLPAQQNVFFQDRNRRFAIPVNEAGRPLLSASQFDDLVFGINVAEASARRKLELQLQEEIALVHEACTLTAVQTRKLQVAGRGDLAACFARVAVLRERYVSQKFTHAELLPQLIAVHQDLQGGVYLGSSLFLKTLRHVLTEEQRAKWDGFVRERQRAAIVSQLKLLDRAFQITVPAERRAELADLLVDTSRPHAIPDIYPHYYVVLRIHDLGDAARPFFDAPSWDRLRERQEQARQLMPQLQQQGYWLVPKPDDSDAADEEGDAP